MSSPPPPPLTPLDTTLEQNAESQWLVSRLDVYICIVIIMTIFLRSPRGLGRFWRPHEWRDGHLLGYTEAWEQATIPRRPPSVKRRRSSRSEDIELKTWSTPHTSSPQQGSDGETRVEPASPPHIFAVPPVLWPFSDLLSRPLFSSYSNIQVLIMLAYLAVLLYIATNNSNVFLNLNRLTLLAVSQLPFLFAFASRNNVLAWLMGLGFRDFNYLHRFLGRVVLILVNIHGFGYLATFSQTGGIVSHLQMYKTNVWGLLALACFDVLFIFSTSFWRTKVYGVFSLTHNVCYLIAIPAIYLHYPPALPYLIALSVPYFLDRALRLAKTRYVTATIRPLPYLGAVRLEIPSLNCGWRPGQYVHLRILSTSVGWFRWLESHPFTIASAPVVQGLSVGEPGLVLICKKSGRWTKKLYDMAENNLAVDVGVDAGSRAVKVLIEGPYGGPGYAIFSSYSAVVLVAGGSGITFALSVIQDLVQKDLQAQSRVRAIQLVWIIQKPDALTLLLPLFTELVDSCSILSIAVHYTRAHSLRLKRSGSTLKGMDRSLANNADPMFPEIPRGVPIVLNAGRPGQAELTRGIESAIRRVVGGDVNECGQREGEPRATGVLVGVCGPAGMTKDVRIAVSNIDLSRKYQVGGIEVHEETFGW